MQVPGGNKTQNTKYTYPDNNLQDLDNIISWINKISKIYIDKQGNLNKIGKIINQLEQQQNNFNIQKINKIPSISPEDFSIESFINQYLIPQKPVLIKGLTNNWIKENINIIDESLISQKDKKVHVKATKNGLFEGAENINLWSDPDFQEPPREIIEKLSDQNKVLVRPLGIDVPLKDALECIKNGGTEMKYKGNIIKDASFYIEYLDITSYLPLLKQKIDNLLKDYRQILKQEKRQFWLGAGNTTSNLHFDAFENFMVVLKGSKTFKLIEANPENNKKLKEGHLREAIWKIQNQTLERKQFLESTSIVNTPLSNYDDFQSFDVTINEGDVLYLPAWYWHEVYSEKSNQKNGVSMAINFWFNPLFKKQFPCSDCEYSFNQIDYEDIVIQNMNLQNESFKQDL